IAFPRLPLGFEEIGFILQQEAAVDLFAGQTEGGAGGHTVCVCESLQPFLEGISPRLRFKLVKLVQLVAQALQTRCVENWGWHNTVERTCAGLTLQTVQELQESCFGI